MHAVAMMLLLLHGTTAQDGSYSEITSGLGLSIRVQYPTAPEGVPLVVFLHGTKINPSWGDTTALAQFAAQEMGVAFALLEWPNWDGSDYNFDGFSVEYYCNATADKAAQLFGHTETTSLSALCALEAIDCSKGVGVAGYSQGAAIGSMAAALDDRVTAFFSIALNTVVVYADLEEATCHRDATLPPSARRYLHGGADADWNPEQVPLPAPYNDDLEVGIYSLVATSGYDCGDQLDCLQPDGSGYFIVPGVDHFDIYAFSFDEWTGEGMAAFGPMLNGLVWLMARATTDAPGCPCPAGSRRELLFGSVRSPPESACCASF